MTGHFSNISIKGIAAAVPEKVEENIDFADVMGERRLKKQIKLTGVKRRHVPGEHQKTSDLFIVAANHVLEKVKWNRNEIQYLIVVTQNPDFQFPSTAMLIQKELGIGIDCLAFDVNLGCSGYVAGLQIMSGMLQNSKGKGLLLVGDVEYRSTEDRKRPEYADFIANDLLFGFAASATAMEYGDGELDYMQHTDGERYKVIHRKAGEFTSMDGSAVFSFTMNEVANSIISFKKLLKLENEDVDFYVFHQAQKMILESLADICQLEPEKVLTSLENYGNTAGTSIPITICANVDKLSQKESVKLYLCGFGVGLSWGSVYLELDTSVICPVVESDFYLEEEL